jgi:hypothetical protein
MYSLVLKCINHNFTSYNQFQWPKEVGQTVEAPDWNSYPQPERGLHGWLYGEGNCYLSEFAEYSDSKWLVLKVNSFDIVRLHGNCKFPEAEVVFIGSKTEAAEYLIANEPSANRSKVIGARVAGNGNLIGAEMSEVIGGDSCNVIVERSATVLVGKDSSVITKEFCKVEAESLANVLTMNDCDVKVGKNSRVRTGRRSAIGVGERSECACDEFSLVTAGADCTIVAGLFSSVRAGRGSKITFLAPRGSVSVTIDGMAYKVGQWYTLKNGEVVETGIEE